MNVIGFIFFPEHVRVIGSGFQTCRIILVHIVPKNLVLYINCTRSPNLYYNFVVSLRFNLPSIILINKPYIFFMSCLECTNLKN